MPPLTESGNEIEKSCGISSRAIRSVLVVAVRSAEPRCPVRPTPPGRDSVAARDVSEVGAEVESGNFGSAIALPFQKIPDMGIIVLSHNASQCKRHGQNARMPSAIQPRYRPLTCGKSTFKSSRYGILVLNISPQLASPWLLDQVMSENGVFDVLDDRRHHWGKVLLFRDLA